MGIMGGSCTVTKFRSTRDLTKDIYEEEVSEKKFYVPKQTRTETLFFFFFVDLPRNKLENENNIIYRCAKIR